MRSDDKRRFGKESSSSSSEKFTRADRGEADALRRDIERTQGKHLTEQDATNKLQELRGDLDGIQDEETKRQERMAREAEDKPLNAETKTIKEEEKAALATAQQEQSSEKLIEEEKKQKVEQSQSEEEHMQQMG